MDSIKTFFLALSRLLFFIVFYSLFFCMFFSLFLLFLILFFELTETTRFFYYAFNWLILHKLFSIILFVILYLFGFYRFMKSFLKIYIRINPDILNLLKEKDNE